MPIEGVTNGYKTVSMTKSVPVADTESLKAWLNEQLSDWLSGQRDGGTNKMVAGSKAVDLIIEAGFTLNPPKVTR